MEIYISGYGNVSDSKLVIFFPADFVDEENKGELISTVGTLREVPIDNTVGMTISKLHPMIFNRTRTPPDLQIYGEAKNQDGAPIVVRTKVSDECGSGDHRFQVILSWQDGSSWHTTQTFATVHVRSDVERYGQAYAVILTAIIVGLSALLAYVLSHMR